MKGYINENFGDLFFESTGSIENSENLRIELGKVVENISKDNYLEISYNFSKNYNYLLNIFKNGYFLSNDSFNALLTYHYSKKYNQNLNVYNYSFSNKDLEKVDIYEKMDFIFSSYGITYENLFNALPNILKILKIGGIVFFELPSYWFFRDDLNEDEKSILNYSKTSDKRWLFTEDIKSIIEENGGEIVSIKKTNDQKILNRIELSCLSSLVKLHKASIENNIAILEVANIKENNHILNSAVLIIKKIKKTLTKDSLFNL